MKVTGRIQYDLDYEPLPEVLMKVHNEDESLIPVRVTLADINSTFDIWTMYGKLTRMAILKPEYQTDFEDLGKWTLLMIFDQHREEVVKLAVDMAKMRFGHIMAWYAMWRKWPVQYHVWSWVINVPNVEDPREVGALGYSDTYKGWWNLVHQSQDSEFPIEGNAVDWDLDVHRCYWERWIEMMKSKTYMPKVFRYPRVIVEDEAEDLGEED